MPATPATKTDPDAWTIDDAINLRTFLVNNPRFLRELDRRRPKIEGNTMEARAVTGSDAKGYFDLLDAINLLQYDPIIGSDDPGFVESGLAEP